MFEKKIIIKDDSLVAGNKKISWNQIIGIREHDNAVFRKISNRFPRAEIFLHGGRVVTISNQNKFVNQSSFPIIPESNEYEFTINIIRNNAKNIVSVFEHWIEWRLILPIALLEIIAFIISIILEKRFDQTVIIMIIAGIFGTILGWAWEKRERAKFNEAPNKVDSVE